MVKFVLFLAYWVLFILSFSTFSSCRVIEHTFNVQSVIARRLCKDQAITVVNGSFPGPTVYAEEGDTLIIHVINESPYNMTIHWHGVKQQLSCWADGTSYITQCPIRPGHNFTHRFEVSGQEGTLWWHAHTSYHRATVHGAIIIYPRKGSSYPFPKPDEEVPIILGEWWNENVTGIEKLLDIGSFGPNSSYASLINGYPGNLHSCSSPHVRRSLKVPQIQKDSAPELSSVVQHMGPGTFTLKVTHGKTYLLRIINAAMSPNFVFAIANHKLIVVAADASYINPYTIDTLVVSPGQTYDVLLVADQTPQQYYMATQVHRTSTAKIPNIIPGTAPLVYENAPNSNSPPIFPHLIHMHDVVTTYNFLSGLRSLDGAPFWEPVPQKVDEHMFITTSFGLLPCNTPEKCRQFPNRMALITALNNESFILPKKLSLLHAFYHNVEGIYDDDFPNKPPFEFDYTDGKLNSDITSFDNFAICKCWGKQSTKVRRIKFNSTVEIVFQGTSCVKGKNHPIHLHGHNFYVLGQGYGNYNATEHSTQLNLENPVVRNTVDVLANGWVVIRFRADNPGVWFVHCHNEAHVPGGMATAFIVEDGPTLSTKLPPPPSDLPEC